MRTIKFILLDGEIECDEGALRSLKSDMIDKMLDSGMQISTEIELDFSKEAFEIARKHHQPDHNIYGVTIRMEVIRLTDYMQMTQVCKNHCRRLIEIVKIQHWTIEIAMIAVANNLQLPTYGGAHRADLIDFIFKGWPSSHLHYLTCATDYQHEIREAVCEDSRCTFVIFSDYYDGNPNSRVNYEYVKRGWLDPMSVLKFTIKLSLFIERSMIRKLGGKPLVFDVLTPIARLGGNQRWSRLTKYKHDADLIKGYEVWDDQHRKCIDVLTVDNFRESSPLKYGKQLMNHVTLYAVY